MRGESTRDGTALIFPGMGPIRFDDIARFLLIERHARALSAVADKVLGYSVFDRCRDDGDDDYTEHRQVAFLITCLAMAYWAESALGVKADYCTGPSFGAKAAAVYCGALDIGDAVRITVEQARCERDYFAEHDSDVVTYSFVRASPQLLEELTGQLREWDEPHEVSCYVDDDFYMLTLRETQVDWLVRQLRSRGAMPLYSMRPPMHAAAFAPLRDRVERDVLSRFEFGAPLIPVVADQDGAVLETGEQLRQSLLDGIVRAVRWPQVVSSLRSLGVGRVYVAGPDAIFGRVRRTKAAFETVELHPPTAMRPRPRAALPVPVAS